MASAVISGVTAEIVAANLDRVRERIAAAGADPQAVEILAAVKYLAADALPALVAGGITVVGENRAQELARKRSAPGADQLTWDFIGQLQSRKVRDILPEVRYVHSVATDSALEQLRRHGDDRTRVLIEVNVAGEAGKGGVAPDELPAFLERCPVTVVGLMTMPPLAHRPDDNRPHFAALRALAERHGLRELSMGTSQDYPAAVAEGATIVRLGSTLYEGAT
ncbi:MAG TPA: YggS family pyridoxal phosphate enzyme [Solirubrobacteraceae bacterium]|nr:YggS family pyridoxal phosphate enzyme [Solirubrobacteraceae bacterium]